MKIDTKKYAQVLYNSVKEKSEKEIRQIIKEFAGILYNSNLLVKTDKIINDFIDIWKKETGVLEAELITAHELSPGLDKAISAYLQEIKKAEKVVLKKNIDKNILGGFIIKYEDKVLDGSLRTKLDDLKIKMIK